MREPCLELHERAAELRRAFDLVFAKAPPGPGPSAESVLAVSVGGDTYALRLSEMEGLFANRPITRLPGFAPGFLGVTSVRGAIVPVYSLGAQLSYGAEDSPRWLVLAGKDDRVGLVFERLEGHFLGRIALTTRTEGDETPRPHVRSAIAIERRVIPVVDIRSMLKAIAVSVSSGMSKKGDPS